MIYLYFALSVLFLLLQLWQQSFLLWKVTLWTSIFSRQLEKESCKNKHCQKHKGPGSWAIKHSAHFCQLLPSVNNLDSLCFCFFQHHNLLQQACTALISSQANDISFRLKTYKYNALYLYVYNLNAAEVKAMITHLCTSIRSTVLNQDIDSIGTFFRLWVHRCFPFLSFVCCHITWIRLNCFSAPTLYIALWDPLSNSNLNSQNPLSNNIDFEIRLSFFFFFKSLIDTLTITMDSSAPAPLANNQCRISEHLLQMESAPFKELQRAVITAEDVCTIFQAISAQQSIPKKQQDTFFWSPALFGMIMLRGILFSYSKKHVPYVLLNLILLWHVCLGWHL